MGKVFKVFGILVGILVALIVIAVVVLPMVVDPNDYKGEIVSQVNERTGRDLSIEGDLKLSVFPWLGIEIGRMQLSNAEGFGDAPFAAVNRGAVHVKLMPLLSQELQVSSLVLDGLEVNLAKAESGRTNWDDLLSAAEEEEPEDAAEEDESDVHVELALLSVGGIDINDARVSWDDRQTGEAYTVERLNLKTGEIAPGQPVDLNLGFALTSKAPAIAAELSLLGRVSLDDAAGSLSVDDLKATLDAKGEGLPSGAVKAELTAALNMLRDGSAAKVSDIDLAVGDLRVRGELQARELTAKPRIDGKLAIDEFNLRQWVASADMAPLETADPTVLTRVSANMAIAVQGETVTLKDLSIGLDDTKINGGASVKGDAVSFTVDVDAIDADRYLPPAREASAEKGGDASTGDEELLPVETLKALNVNGTVKIGKLVINRLQAEGIELKVKARDGMLNLDQRINKFYEGNYNGKVSLDLRKKSPTHKIDMALAGVSAGPLLKDLAGEERLLGKGRFSADLNTTGNSVNAIKKALGGNLDFEFADGAVKGINVAQVLRETRARFQGKPVSSGEEPLQTDFTKLSGSGVIKKGVLTNRDLLAMTPFLRVTGAGTVDLVKEALDYEIKPVVVGTAKGQGGEELEDLKGVEVPVRMKGAWASPEYSVDWGAVLVSTQGARIEEKKEEIQKQLEDKLQDKLKGFLR